MAVYASWNIAQLAMIFDANLVYLLDVKLTNAAFITSSIYMGYYCIYWIFDLFLLKHGIQISFMYYSTALYYLSSLCYKRGSNTINTKYGRYIISLIVLCIAMIFIKIVSSLVRIKQKYRQISNKKELKTDKYQRYKMKNSPLMPERNRTAMMEYYDEHYPYINNTKYSHV